MPARAQSERIFQARRVAGNNVFIAVSARERCAPARSFGNRSGLYCGAEITPIDSKGGFAMSVLSLDHSPSAVARRSRRASWLARFLAAVQESRMRSARAEIARHRHLLPAEFELAGNRLDARSEHQL